MGGEDKLHIGECGGHGLSEQAFAYAHPLSSPRHPSPRYLPTLVLLTRRTNATDSQVGYPADHPFDVLGQMSLCNGSAVRQLQSYFPLSSFHPADAIIPQLFPSTLVIWEQTRFRISGWPPSAFATVLRIVMLPYHPSLSADAHSWLLQETSGRLSLQGPWLRRRNSVWQASFLFVTSPF